MNAADLVRFARRDWRAVEEAETEHWRSVKRELGAGAGVSIADELRRYVEAQHPEWPAEEDRAADLAVHERVSLALRRLHGIRRP